MSTSSSSSATGTNGSSFPNISYQNTILATTPSTISSTSTVVSTTSSSSSSSSAFSIIDHSLRHPNLFRNITVMNNFFGGILIGYGCIYGGYYIYKRLNLPKVMNDITTTIIITPLSVFYNTIMFPFKFFNNSSSSSSSSDHKHHKHHHHHHHHKHHHHHHHKLTDSSPLVLDTTTPPSILIETLLSGTPEQQVQILRIIYTLSTDIIFQENLRIEQYKQIPLINHLCEYIHNCYNPSSIPLYQLGLEITANLGLYSNNHSVLDTTGIITLCINNIKKVLVPSHTLADVSCGTGALRTLTNIALSNDNKGLQLLLYHHSLIVTLLIESLNIIENNPLRLQCLKLIQIFINTEDGMNIFRPLVQTSLFLKNFYSAKYNTDAYIRNGLLNSDELLILELSILSTLSLLEKDIYEYTGNGVHITFRNGSPERFVTFSTLTPSMVDGYNMIDNNNDYLSIDNDSQHSLNTSLSSLTNKKLSSPYRTLPNSITSTPQRYILSNTEDNNNILPLSSLSRNNTLSSPSKPVFTAATPPGTPSRRLILAKLKNKPIINNNNKGNTNNNSNGVSSSTKVMTPRKK